MYEAEQKYQPTKCYICEKIKICYTHIYDDKTCKEYIDICHECVDNIKQNSLTNAITLKREQKDNEKLHKALETICVNGLGIMATRAEYKRAFYGGFFNNIEDRPSYKNLIITRV